MKFLSIFLRIVFMFSFIIVYNTHVFSQKKDIKPTIQNNNTTIIQNDVDTTKTTLVQIIRSNRAEGIKLQNIEITYLYGDIVLKQDNIYMRCDSAILNKVYNRVSAYGNVVIQQPDSINVFSDSLTYDGNEKKAHLYGNVVLTDKENKLFTSKLDYDLFTKVASYLNGGMLANNNSQLISDKGYYYTKDKDAFFKGNVKILDDRFTLKADTLKYNTATNVSTFLGATNIFMDSLHLYTESGYYDIQNNYAEFTKNPSLRKNQQTARANTILYDGKSKLTTLKGDASFKDGDKVANADVIRYDEANQKTFLEGNANYQEGVNRKIKADKIIYDAITKAYRTEGKTSFQSNEQNIQANQSFYDEKTKETVLIGDVSIIDKKQAIWADSLRYNESDGNGFANGNVHWKDTTSHTDIYCANAIYNKNKNFLKAFGRPLMKTLLEGDTLYIAADTLQSIEKKEPSTHKILIANKDVRLFKSNFQAVSDSLSYNELDSLFSFYKQPIIWSDTTQFIADTVQIKLKNKVVNKVLLKGNSLIVNSTDEQFFNQIKGRNSEAFFENNTLKRIDVKGNAEAIYYGLDAQNYYVAVNKTICSDMNLHFKENKVQFIDFFGKPNSKLYPMKQVNHEDIKLKNFKWEKNRRPLSLKDLNTKYMYSMK